MPTEPFAVGLDLVSSAYHLTVKMLLSPELPKPGPGLTCRMQFHMESTVPVHTQVEA